MKPRYLSRGGKPLFLVGVNYWARHGGPLMWRRWNPAQVAAELRQMRDLGMNVCRSFLYTPDFMPSPYRVEPEMLERLDQFMALCRDAGMLTIPTFFVGHMSGENWDVPWRQGRNFYSDPWMLERERFYVSTIAARYRDEEAVLAWLLSNEIPLYGGTTDSATGLLWVRAMCDAIRQVDPHHPISTGDGAWSVAGADNGFRLDDLSEVIDFYGPHTYPSESDALRHSYYPSFLIRMIDYGKPTLLEEFGCSTAHASYRHQADYYRTTLHSVFLAGGAGALGWCYSDFPLTHQRPYSHHPFELLFGVTRVDGQPKPAAREIQRFAAILGRLDLAHLELAEPQAAIVVPSYYYYDYPFSGFDRAAMQRAFLEAYVLAKQAHCEVAFWREPYIRSNVAENIEDLTAPALPGRRLLLLPCCHGLTAPALEALGAFAREGGTVYWSYAHPPWVHNFARLFGAEHDLRYGFAEAAPQQMRLRFRQDFGELGAGEELTLTVGPNAVRCPLADTAAEVVAVDERGEPVILLHRLGLGKVIFVAVSAEAGLGQVPECHGGREEMPPQAEPMVRIYRSVAREAGIVAAADTDSPLVELVEVREGERRLVWLVNHSWRAVEGVVACAQEVRAIDFESGREAGGGSRIRYQLGPKEVAVFELAAAGADPGSAAR